MRASTVCARELRVARLGTVGLERALDDDATLLRNRGGVGRGGAVRCGKTSLDVTYGAGETSWIFDDASHRLVGVVASDDSPNGSCNAFTHVYGQTLSEAPDSRAEDHCEVIERCVLCSNQSLGVLCADAISD